MLNLFNFSQKLKSIQCSVLTGLEIKFPAWTAAAAALQSAACAFVIHLLLSSAKSLIKIPAKRSNNSPLSILKSLSLMRARLLVYWLHLINRPISLDDARIETSHTLSRRRDLSSRRILCTLTNALRTALAAVRYCPQCVCDSPSLAHYYANMHSRQIFTERRVFSRIHFICVSAQRAACGNLKEIFIFQDFECVSSHFVHRVAAVANRERCRESPLRFCCSILHLHYREQWIVCIPSYCRNCMLKF